MPTVPRVTPQIQQAGLPGVKAPTDAPLAAFGGGDSLERLTRAATGALDSVSQVAHDARLKAIDTQTQELHAKLVIEKNRLAYSEGGALSRKGKDALGVSQEYGKQFNDYADTLGKDLSDPVARQMFTKIKGSVGADFNGELERHTFTEGQRYSQETLETSVAASREDAILNYHVPGAVAKNLKTQAALINSHASSHAPDWAPLKVRESESKVHGGVIERMLANGQDLEAKGYYDRIKPKMLGSDTVQIEKALEVGSTRGESLRRSDAIMSVAKSMPEAIEQARKIKDPKIQDATIERLKDRFQIQSAAQRQQQELLYQQASNLIEASKDQTSVPPAMWAQLSLAERNAIDSRVEQLRKGIEPEQNGAKYYDLKTLASTPAGRETFLQENLRLYQSQVTRSEMKELIDIQTSMRRGDGKAEAELDGYRTTQQVVNSVFSSAGFDPTPKPKTPAAKIAEAYQRQVDERVAAWKRANGKKDIPTDQVQRIADELVVEGVTKKGWLFDSKKKAFQLEPGEEFVVGADSVPRAERAKIEAALKSRGLPVTDQAISDLYSRKVRGGAGGR